MAQQGSSHGKEPPVIETVTWYVEVGRVLRSSLVVEQMEEFLRPGAWFCFVETDLWG